MERLKGVETLLGTLRFLDLHSSMERLKDGRTLLLSHRREHLHSSMERLKAVPAGCHRNPWLLFTFQYGEIKRAGDGFYPHPRRDLHSSMERLKEEILSPPPANTYNLHSSMERLKGIMLLHPCDTCTHLHSSMERLKGCQRECSRPLLPEFTFQYGEIKRPSRSFRLKCLRRIYIPVWRD